MSGSATLVIAQIVETTRVKIITSETDDRARDNYTIVNGEMLYEDGKHTGAGAPTGALAADELKPRREIPE